jgi:acyl-CoA dehydrogenase
MNFDLTAEQQQFRQFVHDFVAREVKPMAKETDETAEFNWTAVKKMGPIGLLGLEVPEEYGGAAVDAISAAIAVEELGWGCGSTALAISAHNGLALGPIVKYGSRRKRKNGCPNWRRAKANWAAWL